MPARHIAVTDVPADLVDGLQRLQQSLEVPDEFPPEVIAAAEAAAQNPRLPQADRTHLDFVTIDPEGSKDLDQALFIARDNDGYRVHYAIADVAAFVEAGDPIDVEAHTRGLTFYAPHRRTPLHPPALSEGAASLLPDQTRPALVWTFTLTPGGECVEATVTRALVRSRAQLTYEGVQAALDDGTASETLHLLKEVGLLREELEKKRGGVSLPIPEQEVHADGNQWTLSFRTPLPVEGWNAQISLMTGIEAAAMMLRAKVGVLRTLPPADERSLRTLRHTAQALRISWPASMGYPDFVRTLDPAQPRHQAMLNACTLLFRGAGYTAFDGQVPQQRRHAALATEYAHCTAPLRRLVDRYVGEVCLAVSAGTAVPEWARAGLAELPDIMTEADRRAKKYERGIVDLVEALLLRARVGQLFTGTLVDVDDDRSTGSLLLNDPAVQAKVTGRRLRLGEETRAQLTTADVRSGRVEFTAR